MHFYKVLDIGCNHKGTLESIQKIIEVAATLDIQSVKFQYYDVDEIRAYEETQMTTKYTGRIYRLIKKTQLSLEDLQEVASMCGDHDLDFMCTPFINPKKLKELDSLVNRHKIRERDSENEEMLQAARQTGKPFYVSTSSMPWIAEYMGGQIIHPNRRNLFCIPEYPATWDQFWALMPRPSDLSMYDGYSNHVLDIYAPIFASTMAALFWPEKEEYYLEMHFMLQGTSPIDEPVSFTPDMVREVVKWTKRNEELARRLSSRGESLKLSL